MDAIVGDVVTGENLHGRERCMERLWDRIGKNSILSSSGLFDKTSLVRQMQRDPRHGLEVACKDDFVLRPAGRTSPPYRQRAIERLTGALESAELGIWVKERKLGVGL